MGGDTSRPLPPLPNDNNYMGISTYSTDSMLLTYVTKADIEAVRNTICDSWNRGIKEKEFLCEEDSKNPQNRNCLRMKLNGRPFCRIAGKEQGCEMRLMIQAILDALNKIGWKLVVCSDLVESVDLCFFLFQKSVDVDLDPNPLFSVGLSSTNKLQLNDCPDILQEIIKKTCENIWTAGVDSNKKTDRSYRIQLSGKPWSTRDKEDNCAASVLLCDIIKELSERQYDLYCNANCRGTSDTLYFKHNPSLQGAHFSALSVSASDKIRLIKFSSDCCEAVRQEVIECWPEGIQDIQADDTCYEIKLKGKPFDLTFPGWKMQTAVNARRMLTKIFEKLATKGLLLKAGLNVNRDVDEKTVFLFQHGEPSSSPIICLSLNYEDQVQAINAPEEVVETLDKVIKLWEKGEQDMKKIFVGAAYHAKVKGSPWRWSRFGMKCDVVYGQALLLNMLAQVLDLGWKVICSGDISKKYNGQKEKEDFPPDAAAWWLIKC